MIDGIGEQHANARTLSDAYFASGCLQNAAGLGQLDTPIAGVNSNAFYDAARRWSQFVRMIPREQLIGYAVEDGKSVLWFRRFAGWGGQGSTRVEVASGDIQAWRTYEVDGPPGAEVDYYGDLYHPGDRFTGDAADPYFAASGGATVWLLNAGRLGSPAGQDYWDGIADAITSEAPPSGWTNQWLMAFEWHVYSPSESSLWKPAAYSDYFPFGDRCLFFAPEVAQDISLKWHMAYGQALGNYGVMLAEAPSGFRYSRIPGSPSGERLNTIDVGTNPKFPADSDKANFFKSCRLYEPDAEIESCESSIEDGEEIVRVLLTGRLHSTYGETGGAPAAIDRDLDTWDESLIAAEPFRTTENALRCYLLHAYRGRNFSFITGDDAANSAVQTALSDTPFASIYPVIQLTKLIPIPRADGNVTQDGTGTPLWHDPFLQMETYLRAMCEGYVDPLSTFERNNCQIAYSGDDPIDCTLDDVGLWDYTFENLCLQAFAGRWIGCLPSAETSRTAADKTRPDKPHGFGPLPKTSLSAEVFNQFSAALNLLNHVRVDVPWKMEARLLKYTGERVHLLEGAGDPSCGNSGCATVGGKFAYAGAVPPATTPDGTALPPGGVGPWEDVVGSLGAQTVAGLGETCYDFAYWSLGTDRDVYEYRLSLVDPAFLNAIPEGWRDMVHDGDGIATLCCISSVSSWQVKSSTNPGCYTGCDFTQVQQSSVQCAFATAGTLDCGDRAPNSWFLADRSVGSCFLGSGHWLWLRPMTAIDAVVIVPLEDAPVDT